MERFRRQCRWILYAAFISFCSTNSYGQTGNTIENPIVIGSFGSTFQYTDLQNTNNFTNDYSGRPSNDVFYRFTLTTEMTITISHCGSGIEDTYLHLLDASGSRIAYNDDYDGTCSNYYHSYLKKKLAAGTYFIVSEGYWGNGMIYISLSGNISSVGGDALGNPIMIGSFGIDFQYSNAQNTLNFLNDYCRYEDDYYDDEPNDIFYQFTLTKPMEITISHCGSSINDTYLYLLDVFGNRISRNDDYRGADACSNTYHSYLKKVLGAGSYYVVSEGYWENGVIVTSITGETNISGNTLGKPIIVGSFENSFQYSNTQDTRDFTNIYSGRPSNDVFYKITLTKKMELTIKHCGSILSDTYLHLLDASGNRIDYNDDNWNDDKCSNGLHSYLQKVLEAGVYYVVSEGYGQNGVITTSIEGKMLSVEYVYDPAGNRIRRQLLSILLRSANVPEEKEKFRRTFSDKTEEDTEDRTIRVLDLEIIEDPNSHERIVVSPNPTQGPLVIEILAYSEQLQGEIRLLNSAGKILIHKKILSALTDIDLSSYSQGAYLLYIQLNSETFTQKIIKK
jgi:hypothetical protein